MLKKYSLLLMTFLVLTSCGTNNSTITKIQLRNETNEISEWESNYFGSYMGEITIANPPNSIEYEIKITGYQEFSYPVYETKIKIEPNKTDYSFLIPNESSVLEKEFSYDQCKNLILKAELCLIKNDICFGEPLAEETYLHMRSCGE